jgi:hypothetical protein
MARVNDINLEGGQIAYSNFSGRPTQFNPDGGQRTVTFVIPEENAQSLMDAGWKIRQQTFEDGTYRYLLEAKFTFRTRNGQLRDPKIFIVRDGNKLVHVTEDTVDTLDHAEIVSVDAVLGAVYWEWGGKSGITAYINSMYLTIKENAIDEKYRRMLESMDDVPDGIDDLPFPIE